MPINILTAEEARCILMAVDGEQILPEAIRARLTRLQATYDKRRVQRIKRNAE